MYRAWSLCDRHVLSALVAVVNNSSLTPSMVFLFYVIVQNGLSYMIIPGPWTMQWSIHTYVQNKSYLMINLFLFQGNTCEIHMQTESTIVQMKLF